MIPSSVDAIPSSVKVDPLASTLLMTTYYAIRTANTVLKTRSTFTLQVSTRTKQSKVRLLHAQHKQSSINGQALQCFLLLC